MLADGSSSTDSRAYLMRLVRGVEPWDGTEAGQQAEVLSWISSGAPLYRTRKPDVPDPHLVSYFVARNRGGELLLVAHRKAGLWLPSGGHVEPGEDPWETVVRECQEELHATAVAGRIAGERPFFVTCARTRGEGAHTDVSLWYVLELDTVVSYDRREFAGVRWLAPRQILEEPIEVLDPHMHRFVRKLMSGL
ncbi:NUDIX domain-containing protein [Nonomuraea sp. FMUSA5-5]|uniref:NUDIX domain-containing protein n=1 Tax=Nonomuraea composti TaxID=2720023 RepID=A0ABX1BAG5_9ACTN|nr:NUDIX domain-containing protein [Nonomuraea sp. FMUSA5-5]NJP91888.1 NUDIX domain-containing protein [Nonomuraea sp. FMUSA5-5]